MMGACKRFELKRLSIPSIYCLHAHVQVPKVTSAGADGADGVDGANSTDGGGKWKASKKQGGFVLHFLVVRFAALGLFR